MLDFTTDRNYKSSCDVAAKKARVCDHKEEERVGKYMSTRLRRDDVDKIKNLYTDAEFV